MSLLDNQNQLIEQTQLQISDFLYNGNFAEAIELGKLLIDLTIVNRNLGIEIKEQPKPKPLAFGHGNGSVFNQRPQLQQRQLFQPQSQPLIKPAPPQPSQYVWPDGFNGVTLPPNNNGTHDDVWEG